MFSEFFSLDFLFLLPMYLLMAFFMFAFLGFCFVHAPFNRLVFYLCQCSLQHILLQSEEELFEKKSSNNVHEPATAKPKRTIGKMKVQGNLLREESL